jgi:hypothetical protein
MATDTLNMNAMTLPSGQSSDNAATAGAGNATGSALKVEGSKLPAWINSKEGPGALVMDVLRQPSVRKASAIYGDLYVADVSRGVLHFDETNALPSLGLDAQ